MATLRQDLGPVTAYAYAVSEGYTGTEEEFAEVLANFADSAEQVAADAAQVALDKGAVHDDKEAVNSAEGRVTSAVNTFTTTTAPNAVTAVENAGTAQIGLVEAEGTRQIGLVADKGTEQVGAVSSEGTTQIGLVEAKGAEVIASIPGDYSTLQGDIASTYSSSSTYAVGDYVLYSGQLYRCTTAISTAEAWTSAKWTAVALGDDVSDLKSALDEVHVAPETTTFAKMIDTGFQTYSFEDVAKVLPMTVLENMGVANGKLVATSNYDCYIFLNPYYGFTFGVDNLITYLLRTMPAGVSSEVLNGSPITGVADSGYKQYTVNAPKGSIVLFEYAHAYSKIMQTKLFNHYTAKGLELDAVQDAFLRYAETGADTAYIPITVAKATGKIINTNTGGLTSNASYDTYYFEVPVSSISVTCKNGFRAAITTKNPSEISTNGYYVRTVYEYESGRVNTFTAQAGQWVEISVNVNDYPSGIDLFTDFVKSFTLPTLRLDYGQKTSFYKASINGSAKYLYIYFASGNKLVQWELHNVPAQASNSNTWQIGHVMGYDFDGVTVSNGVELVGGGEFELAFKEYGAVDYCGGNNHGDETTDAFVLHIDGKQISDFSTLDGEYHVFDRIEAIEIATVNRCNTPSEDILKHKKTWVFENGHVIVMQTIKYLETLQVSGALFTMFAANRSAFQYGIRQGATDIENMTTQGYTHISNRSNHVCYTMYGANACANIKADVIDYTETAELWINDASDLNKLYYELYPTATSANPVTVQSGSVVSIVTDYDVSYS